MLWPARVKRTIRTLAYGAGTTAVFETIVDSIAVTVEKEIIDSVSVAVAKHKLLNAVVHPIPVLIDKLRYPHSFFLQDESVAISVETSFKPGLLGDVVDVAILMVKHWIAIMTPIINAITVFVDEQVIYSIFIFIFKREVARVFRKSDIIDAIAVGISEQIVDAIAILVQPFGRCLRKEKKYNTKNKENAYHE